MSICLFVLAVLCCSFHMSFDHVLSALLLLAGHIMTIGFDLSEIADANVFTWQSHTLSTLIVGVVGLGTIMPLRQDTVLVAVFGTLGGFVLSGIGLGVWVVLL